MKKKKYRKILLSGFTILLASNIYAFDGFNLNTGSNGFNFGGGNVDYFSEISDNLTDCISSELSAKIAGNIPEFDVCLIDNAISNISSNFNDSLNGFGGMNNGTVEFGFSLGGCSFSAKAKPLKCLRSSVASHCSNRNNPLRKNNIKRGISNYLTSSTSELTKYGDEEILGKACLSYDEKKKKIPKHVEVYGNSHYEDILLTKDGGVYANTRVGKGILKCIEDAKINGYDENSCYPEYDNIDSEGEEDQTSEAEIREKIHEEATVTLASPLNNIVPDLRNREADLNKKLQSECGNKSSRSAANSCIKKYLEEDYGLEEELSTLKLNITQNTAAFSTAVDKATTPKNVIFLTTSNTLKKLPKEDQEDYAISSAKAMAKQTLISTSFKKINKLEKELAEIVYRKVEIASRPFLLKVAKSELGLDE